MTDPLLDIIEGCVLSTTIPVKDIRDKSSDILRRINDRVPVRVLGMARVCPHIVAIELAFRCMNVLFSKDKLFAHVRIPSKELTQALTNCTSILRLSFPRVSAIDIMCVQFGAALKSPTLQLLEDYRKLYVERLDPVRQKLINLDAPEYQAAAYYLAAKHKKASVDKRKLLEVTEISSPLFHKILNDIERVCMRGGDDTSKMKEADNKVMQRVLSKSSLIGMASTSKQVSKGVASSVSNIQEAQSGKTKGEVVASFEKENTIKHTLHAVQEPSLTTTSLSCKSKSSTGALGEIPTTDHSSQDSSLQDELQLASMAAARRAITFTTTKRKTMETGSYNLKASEASKQEKKHRQEEEERQALVLKRKVEQRESYNAWKAKTLKKRKS